MTKLTREQRSELKRRLRRAPQYATENANVSAMPVAELIDLARRWNVAIPTVAEAMAPVAAKTDAVAAFDDDLDTGEDTGTVPAPLPAVDTTKTVESILAKFAGGDFVGFRAALDTLAAEAAKPPVTITETVEVEKIIERVVEVESAAGHLRPSHVPQIVGSVTIPTTAKKVDQWDAPDAPAVDRLYQWPRGTAVAVSKIARGQPIFLTGPAGTGKTTFAEQIAAHQRRPFVRISCHEQTDGPTLVGMMVPDGAGGVRWQDGQLAKAIRRPGTLILIDEPSTARPGAMMILQAVLEPNGKLHIEATGEVVRRAPGVAFILADNTAGHGDETGQYEATRRMNRATLDRMAATVIIDYLPRQDEIRVLKDRTGCAENVAAALVTYAGLTRDGARKGQFTHGIGLRRLVSWAEAIADGIAGADAFEACVLNNASPDDREGMRQLYTVHVGNKL